MIFSPKNCTTCGMPFEPTSGAQKWCLPCRDLRSVKMPDEDRPDAIERQSARKALYGHSPQRELLLAEQALLAQRQTALKTQEARCAAVVIPGPEVSEEILEALHELRARREGMVARDRAWVAEAENAVRWAELNMAYEHARCGLAVTPSPEAHEALSGDWV